MKPIVLAQPTWRKLRTELQKEHPSSVFLLRSRMRDKLGFTPREYNEYNPINGHRRQEVHLDFYSEHKRTMFLLKWTEYLNRSGEWNTLE